MSLKNDESYCTRWGKSLYCNYRPQQSCGKVMFLHLSVILFTWAWADTPPGQTPPSRHPPADTPPADTPPAQCMLGYDQQVGGTHPTEM